MDIVTIQSDEEVLIHNIKLKIELLLWFDIWENYVKARIQEKQMKTTNHQNKPESLVSVCVLFFTESITSSTDFKKYIIEQENKNINTKSRQ